MNHETIAAFQTRGDFGLEVASRYGTMWPPVTVVNEDVFWDPLITENVITPVVTGILGATGHPPVILVLGLIYSLLSLMFFLKHFPSKRGFKMDGVSSNFLLNGCCRLWDILITRVLIEQLAYASKLPSDPGCNHVRDSRTLSMSCHPGGPKIASK